MFHLLTLPFRLAFGLVLGILILPFALLLLPFLLLRFVVKALVGLIVLPFALVAAAFGIFFAALGLALAVIVPLLPLALIGLGVWAVVQMLRPRSQAAIAVRD